MRTASNTSSDQTSTDANTNATREPIRLSVNLAPDVAGVLRNWTTTKGISITEGIRRAIAVWNFIETERAAGNRLAVIERDGDRERVREIVLVD